MNNSYITGRVIGCTVANIPSGAACIAHLPVGFNLCVITALKIQPSHPANRPASLLTPVIGPVIGNSDTHTPSVFQLFQSGKCEPRHIIFSVNVDSQFLSNNLVVPYEDLDKNGALHFKITNNAQLSRGFEVLALYELDLKQNTVPVKLNTTQIRRIHTLKEMYGDENGNEH